MGQLIQLPFYAEEQAADRKCEVDRKSELCKPEPFAVRALGTIILALYVPYVLLKVVFTK
jgi:hypothetical protein